MPIYEYRCEYCNNLIEAQRTINERNSPISRGDDCIIEPEGGGTCIHQYVRTIATPTNTPFETLRDAGVFETPARFRKEYRGY